MVVGLYLARKLLMGRVKKHPSHVLGGAEFLTRARYSPKTSVPVCLFMAYGCSLYNEQDEIVEALINLLTIKKFSKSFSSAGLRPGGQDAQWCPD
jgi:hypothetical protein